MHVPEKAACLETTNHDYSRADGFTAVVYGLDPTSSSADFEESIAPTLRGAGAGGNAGHHAGVAFNVAPGAGEKKDDIYVTLGNVTKTLDTFGCDPAKHQGGSIIVQPQTFAFTAKDAGQDAGPLAPTLRSGGHDADADLSPTLRGIGEGGNADDRAGVAFTALPYTLEVRGRDGEAALEFRQDGTANALRTPGGGRGGMGVGAVAVNERPRALIVRRLTPVECCRLQGFPDNWNSEGIDKNGKRFSMADAPRYRQLGNAVTVNVAHWLARNLAAVYHPPEGAQHGQP